ncbi:hypothetical protein ARAF_0411 [Arsenophonus endosymbiont of Aleurodicus floccissimus]|nr:hypothetical protein ARAF_0411 [Arsenophonus endosymbiont of Aleurodicus floccissimus]
MAFADTNLLLFDALDALNAALQSLSSRYNFSSLSISYSHFLFGILLKSKILSSYLLNLTKIITRIILFFISNSLPELIMFKLILK